MLAAEAKEDFTKCFLQSGVYTVAAVSAIGDVISDAKCLKLWLK
jgi:hypothetical protein